MSQYLRQVEVQFGRPGEEGVAFRGLRVNFDVELTRDSSPNSGVIRVYGLGEDGVAFAQRDETVVRLRVGYDQPYLLFQGNPVDGGVKLSAEGTERVLSVEAQEGGFALKRTPISLSYSEKISLEAVARDVAEEMGLALGAFRFPEGELRIINGRVFNGQAGRILDQITESTGSDWSIQQGALQVLPEGEDTGRQALKFSADNGNLIGSPRPKDEGVEVKGLIAPSLRPGDRFVVDSRQTNGIYRARDVRHHGDSGYQRPFYTTVTARAVDTQEAA